VTENIKDLSQMTDDEFEKYLSTITPHLPIWAREGNKVLYREQSDLSDCQIHSVVWQDKKGKTTKSTHYVRWYD